MFLVLPTLPQMATFSLVSVRQTRRIARSLLCVPPSSKLITVNVLIVDPSPMPVWLAMTQTTATIVGLSIRTRTLGFHATPSLMMTSGTGSPESRLHGGRQ